MRSFCLLLLRKNRANLRRFAENRMLNLRKNAVNVACIRRKRSFSWQTARRKCRAVCLCCQDAGETCILNRETSD